MSSRNLQGCGKEGGRGGGPPETTSAGRGGGRLGRTTGRFAMPRTSTLQPRQCFEGDIPELHGKTYELIGNKSADLYTETTKHIASYVAIKCQHGGDIRRVVETRTCPTMSAPNRTAIVTQLGVPETTTVGDGETAQIVIDPLVQMMFAEEVKEHVKRTRKLEENIKFLWTVLWAKSSQAVRNRLEALNTYETMKQESNGLELLVAIKDLLYNVQDRKYTPLSIHLAKRQFYLNSQGRSTSVAAYYEQFNNTIDMLEHCGASLGEDDSIITKVLEHHDIDPTTATATQKENTRIEAQEWYYGLAFLMGADCVRFGRYLEELENDFTQGVDRYPKSLVDAHHVLANWEQDQRSLVRLTGGNDGVQFTNMAMSEQEITTQQQQADTQEETEAAPESEGTTLATITTKAPTAGASGRGWGPGGRGAGRGRGQGRKMVTVSAVGNVGTRHQSVTQQMKKYNNIVQANCQQQKTSRANNYYTQVFFRMTPTTTSQPVGSSTKLTLCMTILTLRPDMGDGFQWSGYYLTINPPLMCSLIAASSGTSGGSTNTCISIAQLGSPERTWWVRSQDMELCGFTQMVLPTSFLCPGSKPNIGLLLTVMKTMNSLSISQTDQHATSRNLVVGFTILTCQQGLQEWWKLEWHWLLL